MVPRSDVYSVNKCGKKCEAIRERVEGHDGRPGRGMASSKWGGERSARLHAGRVGNSHRANSFSQSRPSIAPGHSPPGRDAMGALMQGEE